jgi:hypothetical protein
MGHLMTVQNLLLLTRQPLNFEREDFPAPVGLYPFKMRLAPLTRRSLATYVVAESPVDATGIEDIVELATQEAGTMPNRVGVLYALLGVVFTKQGELEPNASGGDAWYRTVRDMAYLAFVQEPGPERWHLPDGAFDGSTVSRQAKDADWAQAQEIRVSTAGDRPSALGALRDISVQGEGPTQPTTDPLGSHFERFRSVYRGDGSTLPFPADEWQPARDVPVDPKLEGAANDPNVIDDPKAKDFARLADLRYALLLGFLEQYFHTSVADREYLKDWCVDEMRKLRTLSTILTALPRSATPGAVAALPFGLPPDLHLPEQPQERWRVHIDRLTAAIALTRHMLETHSPGDVRLQAMRQADEEMLQVAQQAQAGPFPAFLAARRRAWQD